jgi:hypothetical protein
MMAEGFKPLYPAKCVSLRHLHRCRHGAKFKSVESLFFKKVFTANAQRSSDQRCMMTEGIKRSTQQCVFHCAIYTDVGMALNLNRFMVSVPPCSMAEINLESTGV